MKKQLHVTSAKEMERNIKSVKNTKAGIKIKPNGGLWTSTFVEGTSEWNQYAKSENINKVVDEGFILTPTKDAKIYYLTQDTIEEFVNTYINEYKDPLEDLFGLRFRESFYIDFEKLSTKYDALHMDPSKIDSPYMLDYHLFLWDIESTIWFKWCFEDKIERFDVRIKGI